MGNNTEGLKVYVMLTYIHANHESNMRKVGDQIKKSLVETYFILEWRKKCVIFYFLNYIFKIFKYYLYIKLVFFINIF